MKNIIFNSVFEGQGVLVYHDQDNQRIEIYFRKLKTLKDNILQTVIELCLNSTQADSFYIHAPNLEPGSVRELTLAIQPLQKKAVIVSENFKQDDTLHFRYLKPSNVVSDYQRALEFFSPDWYEEEVNRNLTKSLNIQDALSESIDEIFPELQEVEVTTETIFDEELYQRKNAKSINGYDLDI